MSLAANQYLSTSSPTTFFIRPHLCFKEKTLSICHIQLECAREGSQEHANVRLCLEWNERSKKCTIELALQEKNENVSFSQSRGRNAVDFLKLGLLKQSPSYGNMTQQSK